MDGGWKTSKQALNWIPEGSHKIGRPCITWSDITKDIENNGSHMGRGPSPDD